MTKEEARKVLDAVRLGLSDDLADVISMALFILGDLS